MIRLTLFVVFAACSSDYGLDDESPWLDADDHGAGVVPLGSTSGGDEWQTEVDTDTGPVFGRRPDDPPPEFGTDDCSNGVWVDWNGDEMAVLSWGPMALASIDVMEAGLYDVYDLVIAESGAAQTNESAFFRISSLANLTGLPAGVNCGADYVVPDPDNGGPLPAGTTQYLGTFELGVGENTVEVNHYCPRFRAGDCPQFHTDTGTACGGGDSNSVHITGAAVCLVPVL